MDIGTRARLERHWWVIAVVLLALLVSVDVGLGNQINGVYAAAAVLAAISCGPRPTAVIATLAVVAAAASGVWNDNLGRLDWGVRFASCVLLCILAVAAADLNARRREQLERRTLLAQRVLDALAVELTGARTVKDVADGFVGHAMTALGATSAMVMSLDADDVLRSVTWQGRTSGAADQYQELPVDSPLPGARAVREGVDLHYRSLAEIEAAVPQLAGYYPSDRSMHLMPLHRQGTTYGLLALTFPPDLFGSGEDGFLHSLAGALTSAVRRALELQDADSAAQRTSILAEASMTLARSLDLETAYAEVGRLLVPRFADWCSVQLLRDGTLETALIQHRDPETTEWAYSMTGAFPTRMDAPTGAAKVVRTGQSEFYPFIPADLLEAAAQSEEHLTLLRRLGFTSAIVVPLPGREGVIGVLSLIHAESGRRYTEEDVGFLEAIAERAGIALENASSFEQQSERLAGVLQVAEVAQRAILAPPSPRMGPLTLSARYLSAAVEAQIGGDLYEVVPTPTSVRLLVGDVRGKGLAAVRTATVVIGEFRAAAVDSTDLAQVAREVDRRLQPYLPDPEDFVTGVFVDIDHDGTFQVVSCGHPAPMLLTPDGGLVPLELDSAPPLGLGVDPVITRGTLRPGDRLLMFTDGLIEARAPGGGFVDPEPLIADAARAPFDAALDGLLAGLQRETSHALDDDLALLLVGFDPD